MKITNELKRKLDSSTNARLMSLFRSHPSDITTGESGRYIQMIARERVASDESFNDSYVELDGYRTPDVSPNISPLDTPHKNRSPIN